MAVAPIYNRSDIVSFHELTESQQEEMISMSDESQAQEDSYVLLNKGEVAEALPIGMFMRTTGTYWDGVYGTSYFSGYFIKLSKCGGQALVAERFS